ncbi:MAG: hypothetical protein ABSH49_22840 [Bryobacteraceae bacterium]|jgi:hypothetical protein
MIDGPLDQPMVAAITKPIPIHNQTEPMDDYAIHSAGSNQTQ